MSLVYIFLAVFISLAVFCVCSTLYSHPKYVWQHANASTRTQQLQKSVIIVQRPTSWWYKYRDINIYIYLAKYMRTYALHSYHNYTKTILMPCGMPLRKIHIRSCNKYSFLPVFTFWPVYSVVGIVLRWIFTFILLEDGDRTKDFHFKCSQSPV